MLETAPGHCSLLPLLCHHVPFIHFRIPVPRFSGFPSSFPACCSWDQPCIRLLWYGTSMSYFILKGHFISSSSLHRKFAFVSLLLIKMEMWSKPLFLSKDKAPTGFTHNNPANPHCCTHHNLQKEPCAPSAVFMLEKRDGCTLPTLTVYITAAKGRQTCIHGVYCLFFCLACNYRVIFSICCDLRLLYDTSKDNKIKE